ncbi:MAG: type II toxin-antitoxin system ParD family antitoxin [Sphingomonadaceae bacterium]
MDDLSISLPASQQAFVEDQVAGGQYPSVSDYVSELIRADQKAKAQEKLEALLLEGLEGEATPWTKADAERLIRLATTGR